MMHSLLYLVVAKALLLLAPARCGIIPTAIRQGKEIVTIRRNGKVACLVPLVIPVVICCAWVHTAEDDIRIKV